MFRLFSILKRRAWLRRAVTIPTLWVATICALVCAPLAVPGCFLYDLVDRRSSWGRAACVALVYLVAESVGAAVALVLAVFVHRTRKYDAAVQRVWVRALFAGLRWCFGLRLEVDGEELARGGPSIVLVRHVSAGDALLPFFLFGARAGLKTRAVLKRALCFDPCIDLVGHRLSSAFVSRGGRDRSGDLARVAGLAGGLDAGSCVVVYPEGTRFSSERRQSLLDGRGRRPVLAARAAQLRHTLPPRSGGSLALLRAAPNADVILCAHVGFEGLRGWRSLTSGALVGRTIRVSLRRFVAADVPRDPSGADAWLFARWLEMDRWVGDALAEERETAADVLSGRAARGAAAVI